LIGWFLGLLATHQINTFANSANGILYKSPIKLLASGILSVILASMFIQIIGLFTDYFSDLELNAILGIIFLLLFMISIGYILIAMGAKKLQKIEVLK